MNKQYFSGNIGNSEQRFTKGGTEVLSFGVGVRGRKKEGEDRPETMWVNMTAFGTMVGAIQKLAAAGAGFVFETRMEINKTETATYHNFIVTSIEPVWPSEKLAAVEDTKEEEAEEEFPF